MQHRPLIFALCLLAFSIGGCSKAEPTKDEVLNRANDAFAAEDYGNAEKDYREVLRRAPEDPVAMQRLAIIYYDQGQFLQAYQLLNKSAELNRDDLDVQVRLAMALLAIREYQQARDAALLVLDKQPGNTRALTVLIGTAVAAADLEDTRNLIESMRDKDQDRSSYHLALGSLALRQRDEARAETEFKEALKLDPKSAEAHATLANLYWSRKDLKSADEAFKAAADLSSLRSPRWLEYARFKLRTGLPAEAKTIIQNMTAKFPDFLPPRVFAMEIACGEHQDDDCAARVQNVLAQDPLNYEALFQDGLQSLAKGDAAKAIGEFEYLSNTYKRNAHYPYQLARAYLEFAKNANPTNARNATEAAESRLNEALGIDPRLEPAVLLFAELKIRKGSPAAAVDSLTELFKQRPESRQAYYLLATAYSVQQREEAALNVYRQMTEIFPKDPQPWFLIGSSLLAQRQPIEARRAFEKSSDIAPDYLPAMEQLVDLDIADKQYATAFERVQMHIDSDPMIAQAWAVRGKIYFAQGDVTRAEPDLLKAIELDPTLEAGYLMLARLYGATNRQDEAIGTLKTFIQQHKDVSALMQLAALYAQRKDYPAASATYEQLLTVAPNYFPALNNLAGIYSERLGQLDKAYELAKKAREAAPNDPHGADTLGWILFKKADYRNALPLLQESAEKLSSLPEVELHLGMAHYMLGREEPSRTALQKAVDASADFPGKAEARERLALLAIDPRTADSGARLRVENYLSRHPDDPAGLARLGALQERDGEVDQAIKYYERILAGDPLYAPATRALAILYAERSMDIAKAYDFALKAREAYPNDAEIAKTLGILNYRRDFYPRSVELLEEASAKRNNDAEIFYYLGQAHYQLKQWIECKASLDRAEGLNLSAKLAEEARRVLRECADNLPQP